MKNEDLHTCSGGSELNFVDHWTDVTIQDAVSKGATLRQQKIKQSPYRKVHHIVKNNYDEPSTSRSNQFYQVLRVTNNVAHCANQQRKVPGLVPDYRNPVNIKSRKTKRRNPVKRCPIRIAELAVPTKRHCLDTWRNNFKVIPNFMVERLKQRVMDEKPIVLIADAVNCFERRKTRLRKRTFKKQHLDVEHTRMRELKLLCAIFGYKVTLKLRRPMNLSLNAGLERINSIVKGEINSILRYKHSSRRKEINKELLEEISRKVTVWIDSIVEESNFCLLEENLQELDEEEGPVLDIIDDLVDEIPIICEPSGLDKCIEKSSEIELSDLSKEKSAEGSIDHLIGVNINQLINDLYTGALENAERQILEKQDDHLSADTTSGQQQIELSISPNNEYVAENVRGELNNLVKQIIIDLITVDNQFQDETYSEDNSEETRQASNQDLSNQSYEFKENYIDPLQTSEILLVKENNIATEATNISTQSKTSIVDLEYNENDTIIDDLKNDTNENTEIIKEMINDFLNTNVWNLESNILTIDEKITKADDIEVIFNQDALETEDLIEDGQNELFDKDRESKQVEADIIQKDVEKEDSAKSNETEQIIKDVLIRIFENLAVEPSHDENETIEDNKKVKFSTIDMGIGVNKNVFKKLSGQELIIQTPSTDYLNLNIDFAPPNENLLSTADESWPQNIGLPIIKVTESVNKSVTSLGKIFEIDEKGISCENSNYSVQNSEMLIDIQLASMSMDNSKSNNMLLAPFQNETEIIVGKKETKKIEKEKSQPRNAEKQSIKKSQIKVKPRDVAKNKPRNGNGKILTKSTNVQQKLDKKYINAYNKKEKPKKDKTPQYSDKVPNKINRTKLSEKRKDVAKNKINGNRTGINQKTQIKPEIVKDAEIIIDTLDVISKEDRGDGLKNEEKHGAYSCEKLFSTDQKTKSKQSGIIKIDAYDILKWCKGLENVIENLETWNAWINSTCKCIIYLKQKGNNKSLKSMEKARGKWKMLHWNIKQDRILWRDMKQHNRDGLKSYKKYYHDIKNGAWKFQMCDCSNNCQIKN